MSRTLIIKNKNIFKSDCDSLKQNFTDKWIEYLISIKIIKDKFTDENK